MSPSPNIELQTNAVVAQYIHEISVRHRRREPDSGTGRAARPRARSRISTQPRKRLKLMDSRLATAGQPG